MSVKIFKVDLGFANPQEMYTDSLTFLQNIKLTQIQLNIIKNENVVPMLYQVIKKRLQHFC